MAKPKAVLSQPGPAGSYYDDVPVVSMRDVALSIEAKAEESRKRNKGAPEAPVYTDPWDDEDKGPAPPKTRVGKAQQEAAKDASHVRASLNKRTLATRDAYDAIVAKHGEPLEELAQIGFNRANDVSVRVNALKELAAYGHSKLKTIEHTGAGGEPLQFKMTLIQNILQAASGNFEKEVNETSE